MIQRPEDSLVTIHASGYAYNRIIEVRGYINNGCIERGEKGNTTISSALDALIGRLNELEEEGFNRYLNEKEAGERQKYWDDDFASLRAAGRIP